MPTFEEIAKYWVFDLQNSPKELMEFNKDLMDKGSFTIDQAFLETRLTGKSATWSGYSKFDGSPSDFLSYENLRRYPDPELLNRVFDYKEEIAENLDLGGDFDANKLKFTSLPKGVFDFGMASKGLYRKVEYFDPKIQKIINDKLVRSKTVNDKKEYYYNTPLGQQKVVKQQKGTFDVSQNCEGVTVLYSEKNDLFLPYKDEKIFNGCGGFKPDGEPIKLQYATSIKKVFLYRESLGGGINDYVELYVPNSISANMTSENALVRNMPALIVAEILENAGVKTRIYGINVKQLAVRKGGICQSVVIKDFGENLDLNKTASFTADIRFFRTQQVYQSSRMVGLKNGYDNSWSIKNANNGSGYPYSPDFSGFSPVFNAYKNWIFNNKGSLKYSTKIQNQNLMIVGGLSASQQLTFDKQNETTKKKIQSEVYRMLDYVGMMMSKNLNTFIKKIVDRRSKENISEFSTKAYLLRTLEKNTQIISPTDKKNLEQFTTPPSVARQTKEKVDQIIESINQVIK